MQAEHVGKMSLLWILLCYSLLGFGSYAFRQTDWLFVTKYAPQNLSGIMMGLWWMINAFAGLTAGLVAQLIGFQSTAQLKSRSTITNLSKWVYKSNNSRYNNYLCIILNP